MPVAEASLEERIIEGIRDWQRRYNCEADTAGLCFDLDLSPDVLHLGLARLESRGVIRRVRNQGHLDVALVEG